MINISDIYTAIFEVITTSIVSGVSMVKKRNSKYNMQAENARLEMNIAHLKSEI